MADEKALFLVNIGQLLTLRSSSAGPRRGPELKQLGMVKEGAILCAGGKIVSVGTTKDALRDPWLKKNRKKITELDCSNHVVMPGFVDSHTHPAFLGPRLGDFERRIAGASYQAIGDGGGGIRSSVHAVREATKAELAGQVLSALNQMAGQGTTTVEAKSGYGLNLESELKSLEAIRQASFEWPGTVIATCLGAHVVPQEYQGRSHKYVELVCKKMIPEVARRNLAVFVDVFADRGGFTTEDTEKIFESATKHGLGVRAHVCQFTECVLWPLLEYHPASFDHMDHVMAEDIPQLAKHDTVATLVPGANYFLGLEEFPPARTLIDRGVPVALATDYNPGSSPTLSMPFILSLACTQMKMSPAEAIATATINGAHALRLADRKGSIEPGKDADLAIFDVDDFREIPYWFAANRCAFTILNGAVSVNTYRMAFGAPRPA